MEHFFNLTAVKNKMKSVPPGQRINNFFAGAADLLTTEQKLDLIKVIEENNKQVIKYIKTSIKPANENITTN